MSFLFFLKLDPSGTLMTGYLFVRGLTCVRKKGELDYFCSFTVFFIFVFSYDHGVVLLLFCSIISGLVWLFLIFCGILLSATSGQLSSPFILPVLVFLPFLPLLAPLLVQFGISSLKNCLQPSLRLCPQENPKCHNAFFGNGMSSVPGLSYKIQRQFWFSES